MFLFFAVLWILIEFACKTIWPWCFHLWEDFLMTNSVLLFCYFNFSINLYIYFFSYIDKDFNIPVAFECLASIIRTPFLIYIWVYFFLFFVFKEICWSIVDLQGCVSFCLQPSGSFLSIFFFIFFSIMVYHRILNIDPCVTQ